MTVGAAGPRADARIEAEHQMMSHIERLAFRHPRIIEFHKFYSEYHVYFETGSERFRVMFRVYETGDGRFFFEQSHFISTPLQDGAQIQARVTHEHAHLALQQGVESITTFYDEAVGKGHQPSRDWFVANDLY